MAEPKISIATRVTPETYARMKKHLEKHGVRMQWLLDKAIEQYLDHYDKRQSKSAA